MPTLQPAPEPGAGVGVALASWLLVLERGISLGLRVHILNQIYNVVADIRDKALCGGSGLLAVGLHFGLVQRLEIVLRRCELG